MILKRNILSMAAVGLLIANQCVHAIASNQADDAVQALSSVTAVVFNIIPFTPFDRAECKINSKKTFRGVSHLSLDEVQDICRQALDIPVNYADNVPSLTVSDGRSTPVKRQLSQGEIFRYNQYAQNQNDITRLTYRFIKYIDKYSQYEEHKLVQDVKKLREILLPLLED